MATAIVMVTAVMGAVMAKVMVKAMQQRTMMGIGNAMGG